MTRHLPSVTSYAENNFNGNLSCGPEFVESDNKLMHGALQHTADENSK